MLHKILGKNKKKHACPIYARNGASRVHWSSSTAPQRELIFHHFLNEDVLFGTSLSPQWKLRTVVVYNDASIGCVSSLLNATYFIRILCAAYQLFQNTGSTVF